MSLHTQASLHRGFSESAPFRIAHQNLGKSWQSCSGVVTCVALLKQRMPGFQDRAEGEEGRRGVPSCASHAASSHRKLLPRAFPCITPPVPAKPFRWEPKRTSNRFASISSFPFRRIFQGTTGWLEKNFLKNDTPPIQCLMVRPGQCGL